MLGINDYKVVGDEMGITPMTDYQFARRAGDHVMAIGIQGGLAKATTGYAYTRIQEDSEAIVASLMECGHPFAVRRVNRPAYRLLDSVMLEVMRRNPACLKPAFQTMFTTNPGPRIFRFLDERASAGEVLRLGMTLPKLPFIVGTGQLIFSRTRGLLSKRAPAPPSPHPGQALRAGSVGPKR